MCTKQPKNEIESKNKWKNIRSHFISCANICSIHGIVHIVRKNISPYERLLWFLLVTSATAWCIALALQAWDRYQTRPTVISIERDYWKWNTTFPAVTLCLQSIDENKADELISSMELPNDTETSFRSFLSDLATGNFTTYYKFDQYSNISLFQNVDKYLEWVLTVQVTFENVEISQTFGRMGYFQSMFTEFGLCFVYNSKIAIYSSAAYWSKRSMELVTPKETLVINPSILSPSLSVTNLFGPFKIFFHSPHEIPDISTRGVDIPSGTFTAFQLEIISMWTPYEVRNLKINQRNCRLTEESNLKHSPVYSYNLCRMECRIRLCMKLCNCLPFFYRRLSGEPICTPAGLYCLSKFKDSIIHLRDKHNKKACLCAQNCDGNKIKIIKQEKTDWFLESNIKLWILKYPKVRYIRSLIFSSTNLLVQIGGIAGLFLGCSVLSLVELTYFLSLRFYWGVVRGRVIQ